MNRLAWADKAEPGYFVLRIDDQNTYDVAMAQCDTQERLLGWLLHLSEKTWFTTEHVRDFVELVSGYHRWEVRRP